MEAFAVALEGFLFTRVDLLSRLMLIIGTICIFWPSIWIELTGFIIVLFILVTNFSRFNHIQAKA